MIQNSPRRMVLSFFILVLVFSPLGIFAEGKKEKVVLGLDECIKRAVELSPEIGEARYEVEMYEGKKMQADYSRYPQIDFLAITAPSPRARGDQVSSPDDQDHPVISGIFGRSELTLIQPIYTFGKISNFRNAAEGGIKVSKAGVSKNTSDIILRTKQLYYGFLLTKELKSFILEIREELVEAIDKVEKQLNAGSPWADEIDEYKLKTFLGEVDKNLNEIEKNMAIAKDALKTSAGAPKEADFDIADGSLLPEDEPVITLEEGINKARLLRPEFIQLREGIKAREALVKAEKSNYYPMLFAGARATLAGATNRDRLHNPFVYDELNQSYGAVFLGLKWTIDFGITKGKVMEAEAEYKKLLEKKRFADEGIPFQVRKVYSEIKEAKQSIAATESAHRNAKKWLVAAVANFDMGVGEAKEIAEAVKMYAFSRAGNLQSIYNEKIAYANLYYLTGMDTAER